MQLGRYLDFLRTVAHTSSAGYTTVGLTQAWNSAVISVEECPALAGIVGIGGVVGLVAVDNAAVVVRENRRYVNAVGAGHAVVAVIAGYGVVASYLVGGTGEESVFFIADWLERRICGEVVGEMVHVGHAAEHREYSLGSTGEAESP